MHRFVKFVALIAVCAVFLVMSECVSEDIEREDCAETPAVSFQNDIKPILQTNCIKSGCHNGDNGSERNWTFFANVQAKAEIIKEKTGNKTMPFDIAPTGLPQNQIDLIACWVNQGAQNN